MKPRRREEGLFVQQLGDELVIFDHASYKASTLNASAAFVFNLCDGTRTSEMLAEEVSAKQNVASDEAAAIVDLALDRFSRQHLLEESVPPARGNRLISRRKVLQQLATAATVAAIAIPIVTSLRAPSAAASSSNPAAGQPNGPCLVDSNNCPNGYACSPTAFGSNLGTCIKI